MLRPGKKRLTNPAFKFTLLIGFAATIFLSLVSGAAEPIARFEKTYTPQGTAHLTISNTSGDIILSTWNKKAINVRAETDPWVTVEDQVAGDEITVLVKRDLRLGRANFEVFAPARTSISIKNVLGRIEIKGISGHISINSIDSDVRLIGVNSQSVDVKVTSGDVFFDGELQGEGHYSLQSMKGDIDVSLPRETSFNLIARALSENINLSDFIPTLDAITRGAKGISGTHLRGGPKLTLTAYAGRILLHKK